MFVCGTTSNVQVMSPVDGGGALGSPGLTWIVTVPRQVPVRNEVGPDGAVGVLSRPQLESATRGKTAIANFAALVMRSLLPEPPAEETRLRQRTGRPADRNPEP